MLTTIMLTTIMLWKKKFNAEIDSEVFHKLHDYSVLKLNSESSIIERAVKRYLKDHTINKRKDLPPQEIIKKGPLGTFLKPREQRKLVNILKNEHDKPLLESGNGFRSKKI